MSVRECIIDYLLEMTCVYICALLCFCHVKFYVLIIMLISVKQHELWPTVRDMRIGKCLIIIFIICILYIKKIKLFSVVTATKIALCRI